MYLDRMHARFDSHWNRNIANLEKVIKLSIYSWKSHKKMSAHEETLNILVPGVPVSSKHASLERK
jgi:hypothetical protein